MTVEKHEATVEGSEMGEAGRSCNSMVEFGLYSKCNGNSLKGQCSLEE